MFLLFLFVSEYALGELAFELLGGSIAWIDLNIVYYIAIAFIDYSVFKILINRKSIKTNRREEAYLDFSFFSFIVQFYGLSVYVFNLNSDIYSALLLSIMLMKILLLDKAIADVGRYIMDTTNNICRSLLSGYGFQYYAVICAIKERKEER